MRQSPPAPPTRRDGPVTVRVQRERTLRAKLEESWPLLVAGSGCVALAVVLELQRATRTVDHLSPTFLFLAVGLTGIAGGVASFIVGPEEGPGVVPVAAAAPAESVPLKTHGLAPRAGVSDRWNGRPIPDVLVAPSARPAPEEPEGWAGDSEPSEIPPSLLLHPDTYQRPAIWNKGRLLRLSHEGMLTVYSLDDALRDLELIEQVVHTRRRGVGSGGRAQGSDSSARPDDES